MIVVKSRMVPDLRQERHDLLAVWLWRVVRTQLAWGEQHYAPSGPSRILRHDRDAGRLDGDGRCAERGVLGAKLP